MLGSYSNLLPDVILKDDFKDIAKILQSGFFGKKADGDNTKVCYGNTTSWGGLPLL